MKTCISLSAFLLLCCSLLAQKPAEKIPSFTFFRQDSTTFTNQDLTTDKLRYFVFFDTDCDHCQHAIADINKHSNDFEKASLYLITLDKNNKIDPFMIKYASQLKGKSNVTILQDTLQEFIVKFKPKKYPAMFLYSSQSELILYSDNEKEVPKFLKQINVEMKK